MLNPAFNVKLGQQILSGLVVTGKFDGFRLIILILIFLLVNFIS